MNHIIYFTRKLHNYAGRAIYINLLGMMIVGLLDGAGLLLLVPMLSIIGIIDFQVSEIPGLGVLEFLHQMPQRQALMVVLLMYIGLAVGQSLMSRLLSIRESRLLIGFINHVRLEIYRAILQAGWFFFIRKRKSDLITSLTDQLGRVTNGAYLVLQFIASFIFTLVQIGIALFISIPITLSVLGFGLIVILFSRRFIKQSAKIGGRAIHLHQSYIAGITDQLNGMKDIKSNSLESSRYRWLQAWSKDTAEERDISVRIRSNSQLLYKAASTCVIALFIYCSVALFQNEGGYLLLIIALFARLWPRFTGLQSNLENIAMAIPAYKALMELQEESRKAAELDVINKREGKAANEDEAAAPMKVEKLLECRQVYFRYNQDLPDYTLEAINLQIPANGMTAIVGQSGAGKSTLIDLLTGLLKPELGEVLIDGNTLADSAIQSLKRSISYVPQDPFLFHGSVRDNLIMVDPEASEERMWEALEFSSAAEFVRQLPDGLDTVIGDRGIRLSGGERQRLVLARAILRKPSILILDEATSALDIINETKIQEAIERLKGSMTVIVIAHRLTTIRNADQVIVLDKGRIVQVGDFMKLSGDKKGLFSRLLSNQMQIAT